jgi:hypothetical protein
MYWLCKYWLVVYSISNHNLTKKMGIACARFYKFINMCQIFKSQSIQIQSPIKSFFSNVDLVWIPEVKHGGTNKVSIKIVYIAHAHVCEFLEGKWGDVETLVERNMHQNLPPQKDIKTPSIKNHLDHIWYSVMFHAFFFSFEMLFTNTYDPYRRYVLYVWSCLWSQWSLQWSKPCKIDQTRMFG